MPELHLCIISGQSLPNLLPLCLYQPQRIALAVSGDMQDRIKAMTDTLLKLGLIQSESEVISLPDMPDHDYAKMLTWAKNHIALLRQVLPEHQFVFNATGGTKLMSQALTSACLEQPNSAVLYCDTSHDRIEWLSPEARLQELPDGLLNSASILKANGIEREASLSDDPEWRSKVQARAWLTDWLASKAGNALASFFPALNAALHELEAEQLPSQVRFHKPLNYQGQNALQRLAKQQLIQIQETEAQQPPAFFLDSEDSLRYLRGGWLEEYLWLCLTNAGLKDVHCSQEIRASLGQTDHSKLNELDVVVGHRNRVLVIECKTANLLRAGAYNQMLDKLDSLGKRTGGLLTQCWLVAARWPSYDEDQQNRLRLLARNRNITLVEPRHLADLPQRIHAWKNTLRLELN